jgi:hypothetical protein
MRHLPVLAIALAACQDPGPQTLGYYGSGGVDTGYLDNNNNNNSSSGGGGSTSTEDCDPSWEDAGPDNRDRDQEDREEKMYPGSDCMACHDAGGIGVEYDDGEVEDLFTIAGTLFDDVDGIESLQGASVIVTGDDGQVVTMTTNSAGNFFTERSVRLPATTVVEHGGVIREMFSSFDAPGCNSCHACDGEALGKAYH